MAVTGFVTAPISAIWDPVSRSDRSLEIGTSYFEGVQSGWPDTSVSQSSSRMHMSSTYMSSYGAGFNAPMQSSVRTETASSYWETRRVGTDETISSSKRSFIQDRGTIVEGSFYGGGGFTSLKRTITASTHHYTSNPDGVTDTPQVGTPSSTTDYNDLAYQRLPLTRTQSQTFPVRNTATTTVDKVLWTADASGLNTTVEPRPTTTTVSAAALTETLTSVSGSTYLATTAPIGYTSVHALFWGEDEDVFFARYLTSDPGIEIPFTQAFEGPAPGSSKLLGGWWRGTHSLIGTTEGTPWTSIATGGTNLPVTSTYTTLSSSTVPTTIQDGWGTTTSQHVYFDTVESVVALSLIGSRQTTTIGRTSMTGTALVGVRLRTIIDGNTYTHASLYTMNRLSVFGGSVNSQTYSNLTHRVNSSLTEAVVTTAFYSRQSIYGQRLLPTPPYITNLFPGDTYSYKVAGSPMSVTGTFDGEGVAYMDLELPVYRRARSMAPGARNSRTVLNYVDNVGITYDAPGAVVPSTDMAFANQWGLGISIPDAYTSIATLSAVSSAARGIPIPMVVSSTFTTDTDASVLITQSMESVTIATANSSTPPVTSSFALGYILPGGKTHHALVGWGVGTAAYANPFTVGDPVTLRINGAFNVTTFGKLGRDVSTFSSVFRDVDQNLNGGDVWVFDRQLPSTAFTLDLELQVSDIPATHNYTAIKKTGL